MIWRCRNNHGFTLIELVIIILILGIISTVAMRQIGPNIETARVEQTVRELDEIALAITGDPLAYADGARSSFGYIGDIGALPPNLEALVTNPGLGNWNGPYLGFGLSPADFKQDGWGTEYVYTGTLIRSTGSGTNIDKILASSSSVLLGNPIAGTVSNADGTAPGLIFADSIEIRLVYPDGAGSVSTVTVNTNRSGEFQFSNVPIGNHSLDLIFLPDNDTTRHTISVLPGRATRLQLISPADLW